MTDIGFNSYALSNAVKSGHAVKVLNPEDVPEAAHWQVLMQEKVTPYTGWENDGGPSPANTYWTVYAFTDHAAWLGLMQRYFECLTRPRHAFRDAMVLVGYACPGRVSPEVRVVLSGT